MTNCFIVFGRESAVLDNYGEQRSSGVSGHKTCLTLFSENSEWSSRPSGAQGEAVSLFVVAEVPSSPPSAPLAAPPPGDLMIPLKNTETPGAAARPALSRPTQLLAF